MVCSWIPSPQHKYCTFEYTPFLWPQMFQVGKAPLICANLTASLLDDPRTKSIDRILVGQLAVDGCGGKHAMRPEQPAPWSSTAVGPLKRCNEVVLLKRRRGSREGWISILNLGTLGILNCILHCIIACFWQRTMQSWGVILGLPRWTAFREERSVPSWFTRYNSRFLPLACRYLVNPCKSE